MGKLTLFSWRTWHSEVKMEYHTAPYLKLPQAFQVTRNSLVMSFERTRFSPKDSNSWAKLSRTLSTERKMWISVNIDATPLKALYVSNYLSDQEDGEASE
jgi:hypothetical protein